MTDEITKLYKNAGIKPICLIPDRYCGMQPIYDDFTAEKQLELIKWLATHKSNYGVQCFEKQWINCCDFEGESSEYVSEDTDFEQSLSGLINIIWQSLAEQEKEQIKEILNG